MWHETGHRSEVTCMAQSPHKNAFAVGYADGSIRLWNAETSTVIVAFNGHKNAVTALAFDDTGSRLASGSRDTEVIVWDVLAETGLFRCVFFPPGRRFLYSRLSVSLQPTLLLQTSRTQGPNHRSQVSLSFIPFSIPIYIVVAPSRLSPHLIKRYPLEALGPLHPALCSDTCCSSLRDMVHDH